MFWGFVFVFLKIGETDGGVATGDGGFGERLYEGAKMGPRIREGNGRGRVSTRDGGFGERLYEGAEMDPRIREDTGRGARLWFGGVPVGEGPVADVG